MSENEKEIQYQMGIMPKTQVEPKRHFKYTKKLKWGIPIGAIAIVSILVSATLLVGFFNGHQTTTINTPGQTQPLALKLDCLEFNGNTAQWDWVQLGDMNNLDIPLYLNQDYKNKPLPSLNNGQNVTVLYSLYNQNTHDYSFRINITQDWFDNPLSDYYGFTFGVKGDDGFTLVDINNTQFTIASGESYHFYLWYKCDPYYKTPPSGTSPIDISIDSWAIGL